jgi:ComF family protein
MSALGRMLRKAAGPVVDLVLPDGCWANGDVGGGGAAVSFGLSERVREQIAILAVQRYCFHCGLTIGPFERHDARDPCGRCGRRELGVAHVARVGTFSEPLITLVHRLKFGKSWEIAGVLAPFVYQALLGAAERTQSRVDLLVPVPLHWRRRVTRGFNQAQELARAVAGLSGWKRARVLRRTRSTREQTRIDAPTLRTENMRGAFVCRGSAKRHVAGKHVWLIDDVTTTGATLHAAASALRRLPRNDRPASINAAVICVTDHYAPPASARA